MSELKAIKGDITKIEADAIVNAANKTLLGGGGVDGAIHKTGGREIYEQCLTINKEKGGCNPGEAVITGAGMLPADYVIHTVGPVWNGGNDREDQLLADCYVNSLKLAVSKNVKTIAFPNISTGAYGFPKSRAAGIAIKTVDNYLKDNPSIEKVFFVCYDEENYNLYTDYL